MMIVAGKIALIGTAVFFAGIGGVSLDKKDETAAKRAFVLALIVGLIGAFI